MVKRIEKVNMEHFNTENKTNENINYNILIARNESLNLFQLH